MPESLTSLIGDKALAEWHWYAGYSNAVNRQSDIAKANGKEEADEGAGKSGEIESLHRYIVASFAGRHCDAINWPRRYSALHHLGV